jgi:hypothetical protein
MFKEPGSPEASNKSEQIMLLQEQFYSKALEWLTAKAELKILEQQDIKAVDKILDEQNEQLKSQYKSDWENSKQKLVDATTREHALAEEQGKIAEEIAFASNPGEATRNIEEIYERLARERPDLTRLIRSEEYIEKQKKAV